MLDLDFIRENKELVLKAIKDKNAEAVDVDRLLSLGEDRKELQGKIAKVNEERGVSAQNRDAARGTELKEELRVLEEKLRDVEKEFVGLMIKIPNVPSPDTPVGPDESGNVVVREVGTIPQFSFTPKDHIELGKILDGIDNERAGEITGARFTYLKGDVARLQFALIQYAFDVLTDEAILESIARDANLSITITPFVPVIPPVMIKPEVFNAMGRLEPREDRFFIESDNLFLVGSAEHTIGPLHMNETISEEKLPIRYVGYSTCFRREAGSYGKDTKGILRMHQFDKVEIETFVLPEQSYAEQDFLVAIQEYFMRMLELPYRVMLLCTGDMGKPDHRQYDIETWMPGQNTYRETHSADLIAGFQARRLNTRVKRASGKKDHVHMNDATVFAIGRMLIAIMENFQEADGSIRVPNALKRYLPIDRITPRT